MLRKGQDHEVGGHIEATIGYAGPRALHEAMCRRQTSHMSNEDSEKHGVEYRVIASIKDMIYTKARTRSLNFVADLFRSNVNGTKKCTRTFPNKGIPLTSHRPILYRFIQCDDNTQT